MFLDIFVGTKQRYLATSLVSGVIIARDSGYFDVLQFREAAV